MWCNACMTEKPDSEFRITGKGESNNCKKCRVKARGVKAMNDARRREEDYAKRSQQQIDEQVAKSKAKEFDKMLSEKVEDLQREDEINISTRSKIEDILIQKQYDEEIGL